MVEILDRRKEAQPQVFQRDALEEASIHVFVLGTCGPGENAGPVAQHERSFLKARIGRNRKARIGAGAHRAGAARYFNARIKRDHAVLVGEQRVEIQPHDFGNVGRHLRNAHQRQRHGVDVGLRLVAIGPQQARDAG